MTAVVLLLCIILVGLLTARNVSMETQIHADNYRANQASAAASAAMERAVAYFVAGGLDHDGNKVVDFRAPGGFDYTNPETIDCPNPIPATPTDFPFALNAATPNSYARFYFDNADDNPCDDSTTAFCSDIDGDGDGDCMGTLGTNMNRGMAVAHGWSDDCTAMRTQLQCLSDLKIFDNNAGPKQPFVTKVGIGVFGNSKIINRYNNSSIWSGGSDAVHGASYGTYLRPSGTEIADYTEAQLLSSDETSNTQKVSDRNSGNGFDVITDDATLASKTTHLTDLTDRTKNQFFDMFFSLTKAEMKKLAEDGSQLLESGASPVGKTGLIWVEGDLKLNNGDTVGTSSKPAVLIVNGDLDITGGPLYGVVYVTGELKITGNPVIYGSVISENGPNSGAGTLTLVYKPFGDSGNQAPDFFAGGGAISGSWKDWP